MKKRLFSAAIAFLFIFALVSCSSKPYDYDISEYMTLGQYKGVEVSKADVDESVEDTISSFLSSNVITNEITDRAAAEGDVVAIDFEGTMDGEAFEGGTASDQQVKLGGGGLIDDLEQGIVGMKIDEVKTIDVTFPEDYDNTDYAGKDAQFKVTLHSIKEIITPDLTDELVAEKTDFKTVDDYKASLTADARKNLVWGKVVENCTVISYPEKEVKKYYDQMIDYYESYAAYAGMTMSSFITSYMGSSMDAFLTNAAEYAKSQVLKEMIMYSIARAENIEISDADYKELVPSYVEKYGVDSVKELEKQYSKETIKADMMLDKVVAILMDNAQDVA